MSGAYLTSQRFSREPAMDVSRDVRRAVEARIDRVHQEGRLRWFWTGRAKPEEHPLLLVLDADPWSGGELRALQQWWRRQDDHAICAYAPEILLLQPRPAFDRIARIVFCARNEQAAVLCNVQGIDAMFLDRRLGEILPPDDWSIFTLMPAESSHRCRKDGQAAFDSKLVDRLISELWGGNRPVLAWRSHFFQILRYDRGKLKLPGDEAPICCAFADDGERAYFLLHLQNLVAPAQPPGPLLNDNEWRSRFLNDENRLRSFERTLDREFSFRVSRATDYPEGFEVKLTGLRIHFFHDDLLAIEWEIGEEPPGSAVEDLKRPLWCRVFCPARASSPPRPLAQIIEANAHIRVCFSAFVGMRDNPAERTHVALIDSGDPHNADELVIGGNVSSGPLVGWFRRLVELALRPFNLPIADFDWDFAAEEARRHYGVVWDERARLASSIVLEGNAPPPRTDAATRFERLRARLHTADPYGEGFHYDRAFARDELRRGSYNRFAEFGSFYSVSSHSLVYCGFADSAFAISEIHGKHMRQHYRRMFLLALFYQASLDSFARDVADITREHGVATTTFRDRLEPLRRRLIRFVNGLWFDEVTPQIQGIELFEKMRKQLRLRPIYNEVKEEIETADEYQRNQTLADLSVRAIRISLIAGVVALIAISMQYIDVFEPHVKDISTYGRIQGPLASAFIFFFSSLAFLALVVYPLVLWLSDLSLRCWVKRFRDKLVRMIKCLTGKLRHRKYNSSVNKMK